MNIQYPTLGVGVGEEVYQALLESTTRGAFDRCDGQAFGLGLPLKTELQVRAVNARGAPLANVRVSESGGAECSTDGNGQCRLVLSIIQPASSVEIEAKIGEYRDIQVAVDALELKDPLVLVLTPVASHPSTDGGLASAAGSDDSGSATSANPGVVLEYVAAEDEDLVQKLVDQLRRSQRGVDPPKFVDPNAQRVIRYYFEEDEPGAVGLKGEMQTLLAAAGMPFALTPQYVDPKPFPAAKRGLIEVWLPKLHAGVAAVKRTLRANGYYNGVSDEIVPNDTDLVDALKRFQRKEKLPVSGRIGDQTARRLGL